MKKRGIRKCSSTQLLSWHHRNWVVIFTAVLFCSIECYVISKDDTGVLEKRKVNSLPGTEPGIFGRPFYKLLNVTTEKFQFLHRTNFFVLAVTALAVTIISTLMIIWFHEKGVCCWQSATLILYTVSSYFVH